MNMDIIGMLEKLVKDGVLEPRAALGAAWQQGFKEADETFERRRREAETALQMQGMQGMGGRR